ncbi:O-antigen ligase family protein [Fredinandcohnia sp. 179-A 10B2 NHS]|uniref:O-antigen ligase family protein n=1 Tax=Fredinandcohnia sp. 179-A 10B2 NHS TaxID=3235176 RepID=UPI0039A14F09
MANWNNSENKFESFLLLFIILQPILDLLTAFCILVLEINITVGIIVRMIVMVAAAVFLLIRAKEKDNRKYIIYLIGLGIVLLIGFVNNYLSKSPIYMGEEIKLVAKTMYPYLMLGSYILVFKALRANTTIEDKMKNSIVYASLITNIIMVVSIVTGTDYGSYDYMKSGSKGWFFAANELGTLLAISLPIVVLYSIDKTKSWKQLYYWIPSLLMIFSLLAIGTKVGYGAIVIVFAITIFMGLLRFIITRKKSDAKPGILLNTIVAVVILGLLIVFTPHTPMAVNTNLHYQSLQEQEDQGTNTGTETEDPAVDPETVNETHQQEQTEALLFSGRQLYEEMYKEYYQDASVMQRLFGMGYGGNFEEHAKLIERDFHDLFYSFGIIGFIMIIFPFLYYGILLVVAVVKNFSKIFNIKYALIASGLALGLGIAFTAGHVLTAPGVIIFFMVQFAYLLVDLEIE